MTRTIKLPGARKRRWASRLIKLQPPIHGTATDNPITVVCISDTHGHTPTLPHGDLLLHAGDMTEWGSFDEIQSQLTWLSRQQHKHKVIVAGNHDVLLDDEYMLHHAERLPWKRQEEGNKNRKDLDFGSCIYLQNGSVRLKFENGRELTIFGSPITPKSAGNSAVQVSRQQDHWTNKVSPGTDIIVSHGPPYRCLDGFPPAGCGYLLQEVIRVRPSLVVFGHIHRSRGKEDKIFDETRSYFEGVMSGWYGYEAVLMMTATLMWSHVHRVLEFFSPNAKTSLRSKSTTLVNASIVTGVENELVEEVIVVQI